MAIEMKDEFVPFILNHKWPKLKKNAEGKIFSFIDDYLENNPDIRDTNIYIAHCKLPNYFFIGIIFTLIWLTIVIIGSYIQFRKSIFKNPDEDIPGLDHLEMEIIEGESNVVLCQKKITTSNHLYNTLSGKNKHFDGKVILKGKDIVKSGQKHPSFIYLCHPDQLPRSMKAKHFIHFIGKTLRYPKNELVKLVDKLDLSEIAYKSFHDMIEKEKGQVFLRSVTRLSGIKLYFFHEFAKGMSSDSIKEFRDEINQLKKDGKSVIYITNDVFLGHKVGDFITVLKQDADMLSTNF
jgi:ABC-type multidrug transport system ATPase subunit